MMSTLWKDSEMSSSTTTMYERTTQMRRMKSLMREDVRSLMSVNA